MKHALFLTFLIALLLLSLGASESFSGKVVRVSSGDRLTALHDRNPEVVVLYGVACPEKDQAFQVEAEKFMTGLATGQTVTIQVHDYDLYNRTVAEVILSDGRNLSREILKAGLAWWDKANAPEDQELQRLEAEARTAGRGLWADPNPVPPWEWENAVHVPQATVASPASVVQPSNPAPTPYSPSNRSPDYSRPNNRSGFQNSPADRGGFNRPDRGSGRPGRRNRPPRPQ